MEIRPAEGSAIVIIRQDPYMVEIEIYQTKDNKFAMVLEDADDAVKELVRGFYTARSFDTMGQALDRACQYIKNRIHKLEKYGEASLESNKVFD